MTSYIKSISKTKEAEERDRSLPVSYMGSVMIGHGEQFGRDSVYGNCLVGESPDQTPCPPIPTLCVDF